MRIAVLLLIATLQSLGSAHAQELDREGEVRMNFERPSASWLAPSVALTRSKYEFQGMSNTGEGLEFALKFAPTSNAARTFFVSFDLRQRLERIDERGSGLLQIDVAQTRVGIELQYRPMWNYSPGFGASWYFGDVVDARYLGASFNGTSYQLTVSLKPGNVRYFLGFNKGSYREGGGFFRQGRSEEARSLEHLAANLGAEWSFDVETPSWLKINGTANSGF